MKSVLISIQPKWCELIASGKKTIEVRKTAPKLETPFKCYIYCTKDTVDTRGRYLFVNEPKVRSKYGIVGKWSDKEDVGIVNGGSGFAYECYFASGKVIGEFVCDRIYDILPHNDGYDINQYECGWKYGEDDACLTFEEYKKYLGNKNGYGLHISQLKIYDTPKELGEFEKYVKDGNSYCGKFCFKCPIAYKGEDFNQTQEYKCPLQKITRPPQSWCYVEELEL